MSATGLFITGLSTGLVAGGASCAAVQGGLLAGALARRRAAHPAAEAVAAARIPVGAPAGPGPGRPEAAAAHAPQAPKDPVRDGESALVSLGAFLGAKLVSHTLLGALLGALGAAAQPGPRARAALLLTAAGIMVVFALDLLGVKAVRGLVPRAPQAWTRQVRRSTRSGSVFTPAVLGFLTVLLLCGVTLSMSLLAITSSSPVAGAAVMAGFVLGTMPLFALLGFALRASTRLWQGRLSLVTGLVVLAVAAWTFTSALRLGGWAFQDGVLPGGSTPSAAASAEAVRVRPADGQVVTLTVGKTSYSPAAVIARAGVPTRLVLHTRDIVGCTSAFVIPARGIEKVLPKTGRTTLDLGTPKAGTLRYVCGAGMYGGRIEFRAAAPLTAGSRS